MEIYIPNEIVEMILEYFPKKKIRTLCKYYFEQNEYSLLERVDIFYGYVQKKVDDVVFDYKNYRENLPIFVSPKHPYFKRFNFKNTIVNMAKDFNKELHKIYCDGKCVYDDCNIQHEKNLILRNQELTREEKHIIIKDTYECNYCDLCGNLVNYETIKSNGNTFVKFRNLFKLVRYTFLQTYEEILDDNKYINYLINLTELNFELNHLNEIFKEVCYEHNTQLNF